MEDWFLLLSPLAPTPKEAGPRPRFAWWWLAARARMGSRKPPTAQASKRRLEEDAL